MRRKISLSRTPFIGKTLLTVFLAGVIAITSCNSDNGAAGKSTTAVSGNWIVLNVTFKPNTGREAIDSCIISIKNILLDSVNVLHVGKYNAFKPSLLIQNDPFGNPLAFKFTITNNSNLTVLPQAQDTTQLPTPCKCETGCRICNILVINGSFANPSLATYIASVSTE